MYPFFLTFPEPAVEEDFHKFHLEKAYKAEFFRTKLLLLSSCVNLVLSTPHSLRYFVTLKWISTSVVLYGMSQIRRELMGGRLRTAPPFLHLVLHLIWIIFCRILLDWSIPTDAEVLHSLLIKSGVWVAFAANCSPLLSYNYIPLQFIIVAALFSSSQIRYQKGDVITDNLCAFWDFMCEWNGQWLMGIDISCPEPELALGDKASRSHLFLLFSLGWALPGMFSWISEAKSRQAWHRSFRREPMPGYSHTDFIPISHTVVLTLVTMSTVWILLSHYS